MGKNLFKGKSPVALKLIKNNFAAKKFMIKNWYSSVKNFYGNYKKNKKSQCGGNSSYYFVAFLIYKFRIENSFLFYTFSL